MDSPSAAGTVASAPTRGAASVFKRFPTAQRLPAEILLEIFFALRDELMSSISKDHTWAHYAHGLVRITYVCRSWRHVALSLGSLWSSISLAMGPMSLSRFLLRSRKAPLSVYLDVRYHDWEESTEEEAYALLATHASQIQNFVVGDRSPARILRFLATSEYGFPLLRSLEIDIPDCYDPDTDGVPILTSLATGALAHLARARFKYFHSWPLLGRLQSLKELRLDRALTFDTLSAALEALRGMQSLEKLTISRGIYGQRSPPKVISVKLPSLKRLEIYHSAYTEEWVQYVSAPQLDNLFVFIGSESPENEIHPLLKLISNFCIDVAARGHSLHSCSAAYTTEEEVAPEESLEAAEITWHLGNGDYPFTGPSLDIRFQDEDTFSMHPLLCAAMPMHQVRELYVNIDDYFFAWPDLVPHFPGLEDLHMDNGAASWDPRDLVAQQEQSREALMPRLQRVRLSVAECDLLRENGFHTWLRLRHERGHPLEEVNIETWDPDEKWLTEIAGYVKTLRWRVPIEGDEDGGEGKSDAVDEENRPDEGCESHQNGTTDGNEQSAL